MKKITMWLIMIPICAITLYFLLLGIMSTPLSDGMEPTALALFIPIFFMIGICNIIFHIIVGIIGINSERKYIYYNDIRYKKSDRLLIKVIKILGYIFSIFYCYDMILGFIYKNYYLIIGDLLAIVVILFYVAWISSIKKDDTVL